MKLKSVDTVNKQIKLIQDARASEVREIVELISKAAADIEAAAQDMERAMHATDVNAYKEARSEKDEAGIRKEMYEARLAELKNRELITESEYKAMVSSIKKEVAEIEAEDSAKLVEFANWCAIRKMERTAINNEADACLSVLQHDIYRDADRVYADPDKTRFDPRTAQRVDMSENSAWMKDVYLDKDAYTKATGLTLREYSGNGLSQRNVLHVNGKPVTNEQQLKEMLENGKKGE